MRGDMVDYAMTGLIWAFAVTLVCLGIGLVILAATGQVESSCCCR